MITRILALAVLLALALPAAAQKKVYKCKNEKGETYFSNVLDPKRCAGGGAQLNEAGVAVETYDRVKTPEERAADEARAREEAEAKRLADAKAEADRVLMMSYPSEADLSRAHEAEIAAIEGIIATNRLSVQSHERSLSQLLSAAADAERAGNPVPKPIADSIAEVRAQLDALQATIAGKEEEKAKATAEFEQRLTRYREIRDRQQKQVSGQ